jgi:hypothetical protein
MYTIPRGDNEYATLVSPQQGAASAPASGFYQNNYDEVFVNYGAVNSSQSAKNDVNDSKPRL